MTQIGFIGAGNMASAIIKGIHFSSLIIEKEIYAFDISKQKLNELEKFNVIAADSEIEVCNKSTYIILAVKPQNAENVLSKIKETSNEKVIISIMAGISAEYIHSFLGESAKIIITMPNTPMQINQGATAMACGKNVTEDEFILASKIMTSCGIVEKVPMDKMKEIIAINGSSPAFIYQFAKGFIDYAAANNIDQNTAKILFSQSLIGAAKMMMDSSLSIDELIKQVTSPGGTTLAGLDALDNSNFNEAIQNACNACTKQIGRAHV